MATKIFFKDSAPTQAATGITGDLLRKMDLTQGAAAVTYRKIAPNGLTLTPPTSQAQITKYEGSQPVTWMSEPLTGFTCSGTVTFNVRAFESAATVNCTVTAELYRCDINGVIVSTIGVATLARAELGTTEAANNWTLTPTSTVLSDGDRLACRVFLDDAGGTTAVGTVNVVIAGATGATGDSYVQVNEAVTVYANTVQQKTQTGKANITPSGQIPPTGTATGFLRAQTGTAFIKDSWFNSSWIYRKRLVIDNTGRGALTNFPVLIKLSSSRVTYANLKSDGTDLRFVTPDGTQLSYEVGQWNTAGNSYVWVKIPTLLANTSQAAIVYMYYGNAGAADGQNKTDVWSNGYVAVYHFSETASTYADSTSNALTSNTPTLSSRTGDIGLGNCPVFAGTTHFVDWNDNNAYDLSSYTVECLYNYTSAGTAANTGTGGHPTDTYPIFTKGMAEAESQVADIQFFLGHKSVNFVATDFENIATGGDASVNAPRTGSTSLVSGTTYQIAQVVSGSSFHKIYVNGLNDINNSGTEGIIRNPSTGGTQKVGLGRGYVTAGTATGGINGSVDELRISSVARSDDWMAANYATIQDTLVSFQANETFETTKTQTGVTRVTQTVLRTQTGVTRTTVQQPRTQTGITRVTAQPLRTQTGVANLIVTGSTLKTQTGKAAVKNTTTTTQTGIGDVKVTTTINQTGITRVTVQQPRTQLGLADIKATTTRTQTGVSNLAAQRAAQLSWVEFQIPPLGSTINKTQDGKANVKSAVSRAQNGVSDVKASMPKMQTGIAYLNVIGTTLKTQAGVTFILEVGTTQRYQDGKAAILRTVTKVQTGLATLKYVTTRNQSGLASVKASTLRTQLGTSRVTQTVSRTQTGITRITAQPLRVQLGLARVKYITSRTQLGLSSILVTGVTLKTQTGKASVKNAILTLQTGVGRLTQTVLKTQTAVARLAIQSSRLQTGKAAVKNTILRTQLGVAKLAQIVLRTQLGIARLAAQTTRTQTGKASVKNSVLRTQTGVTLIGLNTFQFMSGKGAIRSITDRNQTGNGRIGMTSTSSQTGKSVILRTVPKTQTGTAAIVVTGTTQRLQLGKGAVHRHYNKNQTGTYSLRETKDKFLLGKGRLTRTPITTTNTIAGKGYIKARHQRNYNM